MFCTFKSILSISYIIQEHSQSVTYPLITCLILLLVVAVSHLDSRVGLLVPLCSCWSTSSALGCLHSLLHLLLSPLSSPFHLSLLLHEPYFGLNFSSPFIFVFYFTNVYSSCYYVFFYLLSHIVFKLLCWMSSLFVFSILPFKYKPLSYEIPLQYSLRYFPLVLM